ncbi:MAG TPA: hypothetical protein VKB45_07960 [Gemmatimonadales bacterium]|nr:hypothetical protein [Gemmatimonadales bacterium]
MRMRDAAIGAAAVLCACGRPPDTQTGSGVAHVHVSITGGGDTVGFRIPVRARRCADNHGFVLDGALHGNGLLVWLRDAHPPDGGNYPLLSRGDSAAPRGAIASVRYIVGTVAHGLIVDSGTASLTRAQPPYSVHLKGNGTELAIPGRRSVEVTADPVPLERDTVNCVVQL